MESSHYVSRGGDKLEGALLYFHINVAGKVCLDAGSSTGGFTDCLLEHGAKKVYAVDTAYGELAWKLRQDPRVVVMERTNILYDMDKISLKEGNFDFAVLDLGWTKLHLALSKVFGHLSPEGCVLALVKPQYEISRVESGKGKESRHILTDITARKVAAGVKRQLEDIGFSVSDLFPATVRGESGNQEYFVLIKQGPDEQIRRKVAVERSISGF
jgi:23S rRNA (cytidine1920-2'-O)/16S rRNA (cytidine1409-2'-O)-methyltransferase